MELMQHREYRENNLFIVLLFFSISQTTCNLVRSPVATGKNELTQKRHKNHIYFKFYFYIHKLNYLIITPTCILKATVLKWPGNVFLIIIKSGILRFELATTVFYRQIFLLKAFGVRLCEVWIIDIWQLSLSGHVV